MRLAQRVQSIGESATLKVSRRALELAANGVDIVDFGAGEPDFPSPRCAVEAAVTALRDGFTRYTASPGIPDLRKALASRYAATGAPWEAGDVVVTVGGKGALFEAALALFEEGDEVVLPSPYWVSFPEQIRFAGATPVLVPMSKEDGFRIRAEPILAAVGPATRAIILNSPCNPTGGVLPREELARIVEAAAARDILVISDETYERFVYGGAPHASAAALAGRYPESIVLVGSFSKTYAMTGWRVGYLLGPAAVVTAVNRIQSHATSNVTSFAMIGALAALREAEADVEEMIAEYHLRRDLVTRHLNAMPGVTCAPPDGAFYAFPDVSAHYNERCSGSVDLAQRLLEEARVAVVPGVAFGDDRHIRLSFACSRETIEEGMRRISAALAAGS